MRNGVSGQATRRDVWLVGYRVASDVAAKAVMFVITVVAARRLTQADFGLFALGSTLGWLGSVVADFGLQLHVARVIAQRPLDAVRLLNRWLPVRIATALAALIAGGGVLRLFHVSGIQMTAAMIFAGAYIATGIAEFHYYVFRGIGRSDLESAFTLVQRLSMGALALAVLSWRPEVTSLALAMLIPALMTAAASAVQAYRIAAPVPTQQLNHAPIAGEWLTAVAPLGVGIVLSAAYFRIDVLLIERWLGTEAVALYSSVFRIVDALRLFPAAIVAVALPRLCRTRNMRLVTSIAVPLTTATAITCAVMWIAAGPIVGILYGPAYGGAAQAFRPLLVSLPLMALNFLLTHQLIAWNGQRAYAAICASSLVLNVAANVYLISASGIVGAGWSTLWTEAFLTICCAVALSRSQRATVTAMPSGSAEAMVVSG